MRNKTKLPPVPLVSRDTSRKFSDEQVYELRRRYLKGEKKGAMADEFRTSIRTISDAIHGTLTYRNV